MSEQKMTMLQHNEVVKDAYYKVFDTCGNVRACGRETCIELIEACSCRQPDIYFGNVETGQMNIEAIKEFVGGILKVDNLLHTIGIC